MIDESFFISGSFAVGSMSSKELSYIFQLKGIESEYDQYSVKIFNDIEISMDKGLCKFSFESMNFELMKSISGMISDVLKLSDISHHIEVADEEWNTIHEIKYE